jgi:dTDP-4-amino-4,6-dideoxygalactose transaminase
MSFDTAEQPAILGGPKAKRTPFPKGKRHGELEKRYLSEVIDSDMLFFYLGAKVRALEQRFADLYGMKHCIACSSGTAAVHMAVAALELPAGSEVITSAITDMGSLTGALYQGLVPVFADVDPDTLNMTPEAVRRRIAPKTRAILVVHHAGLAADMDALRVLSAETGIPIVEDCAQAYCCQYKGRLAGTMGRINAFSLNHFKHITCGSGGMILTNDDALRYHASIFLDKCYQRDEGIRNPFFLAPNYQMTELQGAVALAQVEKVEQVVAARNRLGLALDGYLREIPGVRPQATPEGCRHGYFLYLFKLDLDLLRCTSQEFAEALTAEGVPSRARLITGGMPVYQYRIFQNRSAFPGTEWPLQGRVYGAGECPVAEAAFDRWITMNLYEHYTDTDIAETAHAIAKVAHHFRTRAGRGWPASENAAAGSV